jgi:hypothetical protein
MTFFKRLVMAVSLLAAMPAVAGATVYHGFPHLHLTVAVVDAGGGARHFDSRRLVERMFGSKASAENAKLTRQFGATRVASFYTVFTFAVDDALKTARHMLIPLPKSAHPDPASGAQLANAMYHAGVTTSQRYDVGYMLEVLVSHQIHHDIMGDMDKRFSPPVNGDFHLILTTAMQDVAREYSLVDRGAVGTSPAARDQLTRR